LVILRRFFVKWREFFIRKPSVPRRDAKLSEKIDLPTIEEENESVFYPKKTETGDRKIEIV